MTRAAIIGAAGYTGAELARLLVGHPSFDLTVVTSAAEAGRSVGDLYPALEGVELCYVAPNIASIVDAADVAFLAVPHTAAMALAPALIAAGLTVIDLSADFRLRDASVYEAWYGTPHTAVDLLTDAAYGLPELGRERLRGAHLVACPGCYPTATALAAAPALEAGLTLSDTLMVNACSGVSGAGRAASPGTHFCAVNESVATYKVGAHRHTPEMEQTLTQVAGRNIRVVFVPTLVPMTRGLLSTVFMDAAPGVTADSVQATYVERYCDEPFVSVRPPGTMPSTGEVRGSNRAHVGVAFDERTSTIIASVAIDNLVKGASGQAVQCANICLGFDETAGLTWPAPVV